MKTQVSCPRLVFTCPCCNLDLRVRREFGEVFALAAPGAVIETIDPDRITEIQELLLTARIREICVVGSPDCNFLKRALKPIPVDEPGFEAVIRKYRVPSDRGYTLSRKLIRHQANALRDALRQWSPVTSSTIQVRGILACGMTQRFLDVR